MDAYRDEIKYLLLEKSDNISQLCVYCTKEAIENNTIKCKSCQRFSHMKCLLTAQEIDANFNPREKYKHGLCELCQNY